MYCYYYERDLFSISILEKKKKNAGKLPDHLPSEIYH